MSAETASYTGDRNRFEAQLSVEMIMIQKIRKVVEYVDANLDARITIDGLAVAAGLSRSHFCYLFKTETGLSPLRYIKRRRIERARELLATTRLSESEIRSIVGFPDRSHFTREFKKVFGVTPVEYRRAASPDRVIGA